MLGDTWGRRGSLACLTRTPLLPVDLHRHRCSFMLGDVWHGLSHIQRTRRLRPCLCWLLRGSQGGQQPAGRAAACREGSSAASWHLLGNFAATATTHRTARTVRLTQHRLLSWVVVVLRSSGLCIVRRRQQLACYAVLFLSCCSRLTLTQPLSQAVLDGPGGMKRSFCYYTAR
jgi:hypothetical protein